MQRVSTRNDRLDSRRHVLGWAEASYNTSTSTITSGAFLILPGRAVAIVIELVGWNLWLVLRIRIGVVEARGKAGSQWREVITAI